MEKDVFGVHEKTEDGPVVDYLVRIKGVEDILRQGLGGCPVEIRVFIIRTKAHPQYRGIRRQRYRKDDDDAYHADRDRSCAGQGGDRISRAHRAGLVGEEHVKNYNKV